MTYAEQLRHPRWQRRRLERLNKADFRCEKCSVDDRPLHVHHKAYRNGAAPWEYADDELLVLCEDCHRDEHDLRPASPLERFECLLDALTTEAIDRALTVDEMLRGERLAYFSNPDPQFEAERARQLAGLRSRSH